MSTDGAAFCKAKAATAFLSLGQDGEWEMGPAGLDDPSDVGFEHLPPWRVRSLDFGGIGRYARRLSFNGASFSSLQRPNEKGAA